MRGKKKAPTSNNQKSDEPIAKKKPRLLCDLPIPEIPNKIGILYVCGQGDVGQLGLGEDKMEFSKPNPNTLIKNIVDICAGGMHSLCLTKDGEVYSFGCNDEGALGRDSNEEGSEFIPMKIDLPGKCVKISAGDSHSACLLDDGRVFACGSFRDSHGNMGLTLDGNKRIPIELLPGIKSCDIGSGCDHIIILTCNGKVYTIGCGEQGQLGRVTLRSASGDSRRGKSDLLTPGCVSIQLGKLAEKIWATSFCCFAKEFNSSKIFAFGLNNYNQLGLKRKKEIEVRPTVTDLENVEKIVGGQHHTLILSKDKKCYAIGRKDYGRLGLGNLNDHIEKFEEIKVLSDKNIIDISCGDAQSFAVTNDGKLYVFGSNTNNQLGTGSSRDEEEPVLLTAKVQDKKILKVSSGGQHSLFLIEDETYQKNGPMTTNNNEKIKNNKGNLNENISDKENDIKDNLTKKQNNKTKNNKNTATVNEENKTTTVEEVVQENVVVNDTAATSTASNNAPKRGRKKKN